MGNKGKRAMKLKSKVVRYSSIVGGGLMLTDEAGAARFIVNFMGGHIRHQQRAIRGSVGAN